MSQTKIAYRSWVALAMWATPGLALVIVGIVGAFTNPDPSPLLVTIPGFALIAYAWWPCLIVRNDVIIIRNVHTHRVRWRDVVRVQVEPQLPYLGQFMQSVHSLASGRPRVGRDGYPGLVIHTTGPTLAAGGIRASVLADEGTGFAERVARELTVGRRAVQRGDDPVTAIRASRSTSHHEP